VRLRPNRGFPPGLAEQRHPKKFSLRLFDHFTLAEQDPNFRVGYFLSYGNDRAYRGRPERLI
jgi:hypothetical protein